MVALSKVLKRLGPKKAKEMDEAAKKGMFGQPEKAAKGEKNVRLSEKEKADMQASLKEKGKAKEKDVSRMSKKELEDIGYGGKGKKADAALNELDRREINKFREQTKDVAPFPGKKIPAPGTKEKGLSASEKKAAQAELNAPAKKGRSLEQTEKEYTPAQRKQMEEALKKIGRSAMAKGGAVKKYNVGGMVKCGASNPASGGSKK